MDRDRLQQLRSAIYRGDGAAVVHALDGEVPTDVLQLVGDAVIVALEARSPGGRELAQPCVNALRERAWPGDDELAAQLTRALGRGSIPELQPLDVDLDELADVLEAGLGEDGGVIHLRTGEVWPASAMEYAREAELDTPDFDDPQQCLYAPAQGSHDGYRDMESFIAQVQDPARADLLAVAIRGRGAFRRFKDTVSRWPDEEDSWYRFSDEHRRGRARQWLAEPGYRTVPRAAGSSDERS